MLKSIPISYFRTKIDFESLENPPGYHMAVKKNKTARYVIKFVTQFAGKYEEKTRIRNIFAQTNA